MTITQATWTEVKNSQQRKNDTNLLVTIHMLRYLGQQELRQISTFQGDFTKDLRLDTKPKTWLSLRPYVKPALGWIKRGQQTQLDQVLSS